MEMRKDVKGNGHYRLVSCIGKILCKTGKNPNGGL